MANSEEPLRRALLGACGNPNLVFQFSTQGSTLQICINRPEAEPLDYPRLLPGIQSAIAQATDGSFRQLVLYSRIAGNQKPDWKTRIALTLPTVHPEVLSQSSSVPIQTEPADELAQSLSSSRPPVAINPPTTNTDFKDYCFIRNKLLLTAELKPPPNNVAEYVLNFNEFSDPDKYKTLSGLEVVLSGAERPLPADLPVPIQQWLTRLRTFDEQDLRKAAIWFSRYCSRPAETTMEVLAVVDPARHQRIINAQVVATESAAKKEGSFFQTSVPRGVQTTEQPTTTPQSSSKKQKKKIVKRRKKRKSEEDVLEETVEEGTSEPESLEAEAVDEGVVVDEDDEYEYVEIDEALLGKDEPVKLMSNLCHGSVFASFLSIFFTLLPLLLDLPVFSWMIYLCVVLTLTIVFPIVVLIISHNQTIKENAIQALKLFVFTAFGLVIAGLIYGVGEFVLQGRPGILVLAIVIGGLSLGFSLLMSLVAIAKIVREPEKAFIYPFVRRIL